MSYPSWNQYFLNMLSLVSTRSKDQSTKVGCVIVGPGNEIRSTGFNGFPRGIMDHKPERQERPAKYLFIEHAERNAIYNAARSGVALLGCRLYIEFIPCADCARAIIQSGIAEVIIDGQGFEGKMIYWKQRWADSMEASLQMFKEARVRLTIHHEGIVQQQHYFHRAPGETQHHDAHTAFEGTVCMECGTYVPIGGPKEPEAKP